MSTPPTSTSKIPLAICAIVRDEIKYILEWLAFHMVVGVNHFVIYDNDSADGTTQVLQALNKHIPLIYKPWPSVDGVSAQKSAYTDACETLQSDYGFLMFIDVDEFVYTDPANDIADIVSSFEDSVSGIGINQRVFGSSGEQDYRPELVTARFIKRAPVHYRENVFYKSIVRPGWVQSFDSSHGPTMRSGAYVYSDGKPLTHPANAIPGMSSAIVDGPIKLNHYILKSYEEFLAKKKRGGVWSNTQRGRLTRYTADNDKFFYGRDCNINEEVDLTLASMKDVIVKKIDELKTLIAEDVDAALLPE